MQIAYTQDNKTLVANIASGIKPEQAVKAMGLADDAWRVIDAEEAAELQKPTSDELATQARTERDALLTACDWTQMSDSPLSDEAKAAWAEYRQALRDLPKQAGFPENIEWPEEPK